MHGDAKTEAIMKVLIAEDERRLSDALVRILEDAHYQVDAVYNGSDGLIYAEMGDYDVFVCDVMLPGRDGFSIVRELRHKGIATPTIMLTAKGELSDKVQGLDSGADDYMTKPFQPAELLARLRALMRREGAVVLDELKVGDLMLDLQTHDLTCVGKVVHLSYKEFSVLNLLMANARTTVTKDMLIDKVWGVDSDAADNNVEAYISFLRKKLSFVGSRSEIVTLRKIGYRFNFNEAK